MKELNFLRNELSLNVRLKTMVNSSRGDAPLVSVISDLLSMLPILKIEKQLLKIPGFSGFMV